MNQSEVVRRYDIDWLRVMGVLLLIPFHTAIMFSLCPDDVVYVKSIVEAPILVRGAMMLGNFHMPLLFMLAGMSIYYSLNKRSSSQFIKERIKKLLIPIIGGVFIFNQLTTYLYLCSIGENSTLLQHYLMMFTKPVEDLTGRNGSFTVIHLWFATFLLIFSIIGLPLFKWMSTSTKQYRERMVEFFAKPYRLAIFVIPYAATYLLDLLDDKNPVAYFLIVIIGYLLATDERYQKALDRDKWGYLIYSVIAIGGCELFEVISGIELGENMMGIAWLVIEAFRISRRFIPVYAILGLAHGCLNKKSKLLTYLSQSSFTIYVSHMLINTVVGYVILKTHLNVGLQWLLICIITWILCFLFYEVVKRTRPLCYLMGISYRDKSQRSYHKETMLKE